MLKVLREAIDEPVLALFGRLKALAVSVGLSPDVPHDVLKVATWGLVAAAGAALWSSDPSSPMGAVFALGGTFLCVGALVSAFRHEEWDDAARDAAMRGASWHARPFKAAIRMTGLSILAVLLVAVLARGFGGGDWPNELAFLCVVARFAIGDYVEAAEPPPTRA